MFYVPRSKMPQVDIAELPRLIGFSLIQGHQVSFETVATESLHAHQRIDHAKAKNMAPETRMKPILISSDNYVLDGNHRWWGHLHNGDPLISVIRIALPFEKALDFLFTFPSTYSYGDRHFHPITD